MCLENLVGIDRRCSSVVPLSGLYLNGENGLPSLTQHIAASAMNGETAGPVQFFNQMIGLAEEEIKQKFRVRLLPYMRLNSILEDATAGKYPVRRRTETVTKQGGWKVDVCSDEYLSFNLHSIVLFWDTTATIDVKVYDMLTGVLLDTYSVDVVADIPTEKIVSKAYGGDHIFLGIVTEGEGNPYRIEANCSNCGGDDWVDFTPSEMDLAADATDANLRPIGHSYGMLLNYSLSCDPNPFVCNFSALLAEPLRQSAAAHTYRIVQANMERHNTIVTVKVKEAQYWMDYHQAQFDSLMADILKNVAIPECVCFRCNRMIRKRVAVP